MKLYLVRHGETQRNRERLVQGQGDQGLTELGMAQALAVARALAGEGVTALYHSPVKRALESAAAIGLELGLDLQAAPGLEEMDTGELDGLSSQEMRSRYPEFMALWAKDAGSARLPGGETLAVVQERAWKAVQAIAGKHPDGVVAVVSHNFTICTLVCKALDMPIAGFRQFRVDLGSISALEVTAERPRLALLNSTFHLAEVGAQAAQEGR
ncbi:MAG: histidine phosphatase family protein [Chloroflexi bacterium]|nr:histidine phosphatase family protein [Chloroflexota bacterium]